MNRKFLYAFTVAAFFATSVIAIPASQAADKGYKYWGYFQAAPGNSKWSYATTGPTTNVADGSVEGWAFTFSGDSVPNAAMPRVKASFAYLCGKTKAVVGKKRIGVVVDFGSAFLKPLGEKLPPIIKTCVNISPAAIGADVLAAAVKIRATASGMICGINGYHAKDCGTEIDTPKALLPKKSA